MTLNDIQKLLTAKGYQYGEDAAEQVLLGYQLAEERANAYKAALEDLRDWIEDNRVADTYKTLGVYRKRMLLVLDKNVQRVEDMRLTIPGERTPLSE